MGGPKNKCCWCGNKTNLPNTYHAMGPLSEQFENQIKDFDEKYGKEWWENKEIDNKILDNLIQYDQIVNTVSRGIVCADCLDKDDKVYTKFRKNEQRNIPS